MHSQNPPKPAQTSDQWSWHGQSSGGRSRIAQCTCSTHQSHTRTRHSLGFLLPVCAPAGRAHSSCSALGRRPNRWGGSQLHTGHAPAPPKRFGGSHRKHPFIHPPSLQVSATLLACEDATALETEPQIRKAAHPINTVLTAPDAKTFCPHLLTNTAPPKKKTTATYL